MNCRSTSALLTPFTLLSLALLFLVSSSCLAQNDTYLGRYDLYTGFGDLNTPGLNNINQPGFHLQAGINASKWFSYGFDYSVFQGSTVLTTGIATTALQQQLAAELPPGYVLSIPLTATNETYTAGGQLAYRHFKNVTLFARPSLAAFHITATPHPNDIIGGLVAAQLAPTGHLSDWYGAYGAGGGAEFRLTHHIGLRMQLDAVYNHPFSNILAHGSFSYRSSIGPAFHFGKNVLK